MIGPLPLSWLDVTRKLQAAVLADGPGGKVPSNIQRGSGKTELHRLDSPLPRRPARRPAQARFSHRAGGDDRNVHRRAAGKRSSISGTAGVVATIKDEQSKWRAGRGAVGDRRSWSARSRPSVCAEGVQELAATQNKRFAVIADRHWFADR